MKKQSIKSHLKPYSIFQKRKTTMNHAFASALAPNDGYDEQTVDRALILLGQNPNGDLVCVYCGGKAKTWDHVVGLVKDSQLHGFGHQIGNLVPCCGNCNSKKGSKDWQLFIESEIKDARARRKIKMRLTKYLKHYARPIDVNRLKKKMPREWKKYENLKEKTLKLMMKADRIAEKIRNNGA